LDALFYEPVVIKRESGKIGAAWHHAAGVRDGGRCRCRGGRRRLGWWRLAGGHLSHQRRQCHSHRFEHGTGAAGGLRPQHEPFRALLDGKFLDAVKVADDIAPFRIDPGRGQPFIQFLAHHQCQERAEQVSGYRRVGLTEDWPRFEDGFRCPEDRFDTPQFPVRKGH
jgi:hypothetical protein